VYFVLYVFVLYLYFLAPATRDRCGGRKRYGASCLGCTLGTWLCSMSNSIIYHVSCYRFVSQHTYIYHIGPHAHVDTDSDSRQQQQPPAPAPAPAVAQIIQNNTTSSLLYYVLYVSIVLCIVFCIMYFRSLKQTQTQVQGSDLVQGGAPLQGSDHRMSTSVKPQLYSCPPSPLQWPGRVGSVGPNPGQWVRPALERPHWEVPKLVLTISAPPLYPRPNPGQPPMGSKIARRRPLAPGLWV
jgi:hypothetical protein